MLKKSSLLIFAIITVVAAKAQVYEINVRKINRPLVQLSFSGTNPKGHTLTVNNKYFVAGNKPWLPVMGEMHYNRVPDADWETELQKMKAGGISIIATYVFWNEHEITPGEWDWGNNRDLRRFVQLCAKNDLKVWLRIGPWSHGEQLNGGFPNWIQKMKDRRSNDPVYLSASNKFYSQIGEQTRDLFFADGGPIVGIQLENEFAFDRLEHIGTLKKMALANNINPVYFSVTSNTVFNNKETEVIPLQGAYAYRGWEPEGGKATKDFLYGNDQWIMTEALGKVYYDINKYPKGLCEQGAGSQLTYANRFIVEPDVVTAHLQNQIGRGMNLIGYYMYHGGTQTPGLKEPACPESYDFQAPITEFGLTRQSYRQLRVLHHFINDFGQDLAKMDVYEPKDPVRDEKDTSRLRYIVRSDGESGYLFLGNTQVRIPMPDKSISVKVHLHDETIAFPKMVLKGQTNPILPFNMHIGKALLKFATIQPVARIKNGNQTTIFFKKFLNVPVQIAFDRKTIKTSGIRGSSLDRKSNEVIYNVNDSKILSLKDSNGAYFDIVILSEQEAENAWRGVINNKQALVVTSADIFLSTDNLILQQINNRRFKIQSYPKGLKAFTTLKKLSSTDVFDIYEIVKKPYANTVKIHEIGKDKVSFNVPDALPTYVSDLIVKVNYLGDMCKLTQHNQYITDNLFNGTTWKIGLHRFLGKGDINLQIVDWKDRTTGIPADLVEKIKEIGSSFKDLEVYPQYQANIFVN